VFDQLPGLGRHVDGLAPEIAQGPREGAEAIHQGRALVDQHEVRASHDAEPAAHERRRLEGLRPHLDAEPSGPEREFYAAKVHTAAFYAAQVLPTAAALTRVVQSGGASVVATDAALI